ncbi:hypothetical protein E2C01_076074 [Portunus trituberculatus]|uniref:Uncharacterized protein n=1 Tax=Portunus trituberculatus TaxID=210409 RepID=A0A5B7IIT9_PORTR|nr:hypothetical protein [Portunus trituberculatus]
MYLTISISVPRSSESPSNFIPLLRSLVHSQPWIFLSLTITFPWYHIHFTSAQLSGYDAMTWGMRHTEEEKEEEEKEKEEERIQPLQSDFNGHFNRKIR